MPVNTPHPDYEAARLARQLVRDVCTGAGAIKAGQTKYLPMANALDLSDENIARYESYLARAVFYEITKETSLNYIGRAFAKNPMFDSDGNDYLEDDANGAGLSIYQLAQAGLKHQLEQGGFGMLVDYPEQAQGASKLDREINGVRATINKYNLDSIINWRVTKKGNAYLTSLVVLAETITEATDDFFVEKKIEQWRVLKLDTNGLYCVEIWQKGDSGEPSMISQAYPTDASGRQWTEIPFQIVGSFANKWQFGEIPLDPIAQINIAHYHNSADYEDSIFWCGRVQAVIGGLSQDWAQELKKDGVYIGSPTPLMLPVGGSFEFAQAQPNQLVKEGMDDKLAMMIKLGARLVEQGSVNKTATQAEMDSSTQHSVLSLCVANLNEAFNKCLQWVAAFNGTGTNAVFEAKQDFASVSVDAVMAQQLFNAALAGKLSFTTWYDYLRTGKLPEIDYEQESLRIENPNPNDVPV